MDYDYIFKPNTGNALWDKILVNSFYPPYSTNSFRFYTDDLADKVTKSGREIQKLIQDKEEE